jgi:hypothetical protein
MRDADPLVDPLDLITVEGSPGLRVKNKDPYRPGMFSRPLSTGAGGYTAIRT